MSLISQLHDHLPYIDPNASLEDKRSVESLLTAELDALIDSEQLHPFVLPPGSSIFERTLTANSHTSISASGTPRSPEEGIDQKRYNAPSQPNLSNNGNIADHRESLRLAYTSKSYLDLRQLNLSLLDRHGKNAWLISNSQIEESVKAVERELEIARREFENLDSIRGMSQKTAQAELEGLEEAWKLAIGRSIETEIAINALRNEIATYRRQVRN